MITNFILILLHEKSLLSIITISLQMNDTYTYIYQLALSSKLPKITSFTYSRQRIYQWSQPAANAIPHTNAITITITLQLISSQVHHPRHIVYTTHTHYLPHCTVLLTIPPLPLRCVYQRVPLSSFDIVTVTKNFVHIVTFLSSSVSQLDRSRHCHVILYPSLALQAIIPISVTFLSIIACIIT